MSVQQAYFTTEEHEIYINRYDNNYIVEIFTINDKRLINKACIGTYHGAYLYVNKKYLKEGERKWLKNVRGAESAETV